MSDWKLVPVEPTEAMLEALTDRMWRDHTAQTVWAAMVNAAPKLGGWTKFDSNSKPDKVGFYIVLEVNHGTHPSDEYASCIDRWVEFVRPKEWGVYAPGVYYDPGGPRISDGFGWVDSEPESVRYFRYIGPLMDDAPKPGAV